MENLQSYSTKIYAFILVYGPKLIGAILTLLIGLWVIKIIQKTFEKEGLHIPFPQMDVHVQK